jgi:hypothetical protein
MVFVFLAISVYLLVKQCNDFIETQDSSHPWSKPTSLQHCWRQHPIDPCKHFLLAASNKHLPKLRGSWLCTYSPLFLTAYLVDPNNLLGTSFSNIFNLSYILSLGKESTLRMNTIQKVTLYISACLILCKAQEDSELNSSKSFLNDIQSLNCFHYQLLPFTSAQKFLHIVKMVFSFLTRHSCLFLATRHGHILKLNNESCRIWGSHTDG